MTSFRDKPAFTDLVAAVRRHVANLADAQRSSSAAEGSFEAIELRSGIAALQPLLARLEAASTEQDMIDLYDRSKSLMSYIVEEPTTSGEHKAGEFLFPRIRNALEALGIDPIGAPSPGTKAARKFTEG